MPEVGVVIVTHQSADVIDACLESLRQVDALILVVDNGSVDNTVARVRARGVALIANPDNKGFAAAVNQGVRSLDTQLVLLLNPDAILKTSLDPLIARLRAGNTGAVGGKLLNADGSPQRGFNVRAFPTAAALICEILLINRAWPTNPVNWHYRCFGLTLAEANRVDQPAGAFLMFSRAAWDRVDGFDESFFPVWFEDVDFCRRLDAAGYQIWFEPSAQAMHVGGHSAGLLPLEQRVLYWYRSLLKYAARHLTAGGYRIVCVALVLGALMRLCAEAVRNRNFSSSAVYRSIARIAAKSLRGPRYAEAGEVR
jgi:GT2 family glycosyltransferase